MALQCDHKAHLRQSRASKALLRRARMSEKISDRRGWKRPLLPAAPHGLSETHNSQKIMRGISMNPANLSVLLYVACFLCLHPGSVLALQGVKSGADLTCTGVVNTRVVSALSI